MKTVSTPSHLTKKNVWEECLCKDECVLGTRVKETVDFLNKLPLYWAESVYFGGVSHNSYAVRCWVDDNGKWHRDNGPAAVDYEGNIMWYQHGKLHRVDGPAIISADGSKEWYQNDEPYRVDGPASISSDGVEQWLQHGRLHRIDGPAILYPNGAQQWWVNGKLHRVDGPAIIWDDGTEEWYIHGRRLFFHTKRDKTLKPFCKHKFHSAH